MEKLAIKGGKPVRDTMLPYGRQWIEEDDIEAVVDILKSDLLTTGPKIGEFEERLAEYVDCKYAVAFSSGTAALHGAAFAAGISKGEEVITTPLTFAASANCVLYQGGKPVFADVDIKTYNIDPQEISKHLSGRTKAILPVDFAGQPVALEQINEIAVENDLTVIEDGSHSLGAEYNNKRIGGLSDMTVFSFHPVKLIAMGEGGAVTMNNKEYSEKLKLFRNHGITRDKNSLQENHGPWYYEQQALGYNYRITDIQSALGISQLKKINRFLELRRRYARKYNDAFGGIEGVIIPKQLEVTDSSWHLYVIQLELEKLKAGRKEVYEALVAENISVNVHYIPTYYFPYYQDLGYKKGICPNTEFIYERIITLPLFPKMTDDDVSDVIEGVRKVIEHYRNEQI